MFHSTRISFVVIIRFEAMADTPKTESRRSSFFSSLSSSKKKLAPRSSLQFKVGPQFTPTIIQNPVLTSTGEALVPTITPRIDRGFERIDDEWVGYKRNYFTLVSSFQFQGLSFLKFAADHYYVIDPETQLKTRIKYFGIRLTSKCAEDGSSVVLVQHTAKRDRGPQFEPPTFPAVPSALPDHTIIREAANVRNTSKIAKLNRIFFFDRDIHNEDVSLSIKGLQGYPADKIIKVARYERIQFSSSINYKKPALNNKRFKLLVELVGVTSLDTTISLAYTETPPLIVRGRSPSNYQGGDTDQGETDLTSSIQSSVESTPSIENLNDFDTYQILKMATENMDIMNSPLVPSLKKKRGRKPKPKIDNGNNGIKKPKRSKKLIETSSHILEPMTTGLTRHNIVDKHGNLDRITSAYEQHSNEIKNTNAPIETSLVSTPEPATPKTHYESHGEIDEPSEFDVSADFVHLFDSQMHYNSIPIKSSLPSLISPIPKGANSIADSLSLESYETDFMQLKNRLELRKNNHYFHKEFDKINPSAMLGIDDYEDGPSFMSYS